MSALDDLNCFWCGQNGHIYFQCPQMIPLQLEEAAAELEQNESLSAAHAVYIKDGDLQHTAASSPELEVGGCEATLQAPTFQSPSVQAPHSGQSIRFYPLPSPPIFNRYRTPFDLVNALMEYGRMMEEWSRGFQGFVDGDVRAFLQKYPKPSFSLNMGLFCVEVHNPPDPVSRPGNTYLSHARGPSSIPAPFQNPQNANFRYGGGGNDWRVENNGRPVEPFNHSPHTISEQASYQTVENADESPLPTLTAYMADGCPQLVSPLNPNVASPSVVEPTPARGRKPCTLRANVATDSHTPSGSGTIAPKPSRARATTTIAGTRAPRVTKPHAPRKSHAKGVATLSEETVQEEESGEGQAVGEDQGEI
ncbi:hypothetical protein B7494_g8203 [Chlorociboria aeruginascens]|nr:hypothetical protein B7494_g8203 [Chlorociboria aeruginascens]